MKVSDIGEQGLLKILQRFCPSEIIGDDAAILNVDCDRALVVTTDVLVDNIHFSKITTSPEDAGWRAVAANLSDLAAMGASPLGITVGLALPGDVEVDWVERLYQGMSECLQKYNTSIVGGDLVRSPITTISITAFGQVHPNRCIRRHTAKIDDAIVVTGIHGASRMGLELLLNPELGQNLREADKQALILAHQRPQPRLDVLPILWDIPFLNPEFTISGMDSSDGLADAVLQICRASKVGAIVELQKLEWQKLEWQKILVSEALKNWLTPAQILEYTLYGGEDFELVLCLPSELAEIFVEKIGDNAAIIGKITSHPQVILRDQINKNPDQVLTLSRGFQHFNNS